MAIAALFIVCALMGLFFGMEKKKGRVKKEEEINLFSAAKSAVKAHHSDECQSEAFDSE